MSLCCPCRDLARRNHRIGRIGESVQITETICKSLTAKGCSKEPDPDCKTSIPGSNPGGASKFPQQTAILGCGDTVPLREC
jgi:hypothetical protein